MNIGQDGGVVVPFVGATRGAKAAPVAEMRAYWEALRNGRKVPLRSEMDPRGIERSLEYAFMLERIAPQMARFRLAGMHLNDLMGMEVRGMPATAFFSTAARQMMAEVLEQVFAGPVIAEIDLISERAIGRPSLGGTMLLLPMQSDLGDISRALGCLVTEGTIGRGPRRFEISGTRLTPIHENRPTSRAPFEDARGFAEPAAEFKGAPRELPSYLRLVKTDSA